VLKIATFLFLQSWIIPGGKVKAEEEPESSAEREALEEAGVVGSLGRCLGVFDNTERRHREEKDGEFEIWLLLNS
jgi:ADP-ribose pyrophosphatase YjhB (NUDIX family)